MRRLYTHRLYSNLTGVVPEVDRNKYNHLITISPDGDSTLTAALTQAITNAESAADAAYQEYLGNFARRGAGLRAARGGRGRGRGRRGGGRGRP